MLARIAELSSGKQRDTLAGIFHDRGARRFAYQSLSETLLWVGAALLLFAVAARRLALPEVLVALPGRIRARTTAARDASKARSRESASIPPASPATAAVPPGSEPPGAAPPVVGSGLSALLRKKAEAREPRAQVDEAMRAALSQQSKTGAEPAREPLRPSEAPPSTRGGKRALTAAEVLLERRRGRKR
jgi:hypothetical protein